MIAELNGERINPTNMRLGGIRVEAIIKFDMVLSGRIAESLTENFEVFKILDWFDLKDYKDEFTVSSWKPVKEISNDIPSYIVEIEGTCSLGAFQALSKIFSNQDLVLPDTNTQIKSNRRKEKRIIQAHVEVQKMLKSVEVSE